jgi:hypothetical protein
MFTPIEFVLVSVLVVGDPMNGKLKLLYQPLNHYKTIKVCNQEAARLNKKADANTAYICMKVDYE